MEFFIKKNATLPILKFEISKDGRSDFRNNSILEDGTVIYVSLFDRSTKEYAFASKPSYITSETDYNGNLNYYLNYQFSKSDTKNSGTYELQLSIDNNEGTVVLPLSEKIYVGILDSYSANDYDYDSNYLMSLPCCNGSSQNELILLHLYAEYYPGSVQIDYILSANTTFSEDISVSFTDDIGVYVGSPFVVTTGVTINKLHTTGLTQISIYDVDFNNLNRKNQFSNVIIKPELPKITFQLGISSIFPTPTPTPSQTPTQTPTQTQTPSPTSQCYEYITDELGNYILTESGDYIISERNPCITPTPTPTPTNPCVQYLTDEFGNFLLTESGDYIISEINTCVTPTPTKTPTSTNTPTPSITPSITPSGTLTPTPTSTPIPPSIVTDGLVLYYDFSDPISYSGSGSNIIDLSTSNNNGTVVNDYGHISYVSSGNTSYFNWDSNAGGNGGSNSFGSSIWTTSANTYLDFTMILQPDFSMGGIGGIFGFPSDKSVRVYNNGWQLPNPGNGDDWASQPTTYYVNGQVSNQMVSGWNIIGGSKNNTNPAFPNNNTLYIGTSGYDNRNMQGKIAIVLMYNRTLTGQEQIQNYNFFKTRFGL